MKIPLAKTDISEAEIVAVNRVMTSGRLARGDEITTFETEFAAWLGTGHAAAFNSGTSALTAALIALGVAPGDEVIMPALTFIATANAILACGATPVLADVAPDTWNLDPASVQNAISNRTRAIVVVHLFGLTADMTALASVAASHGLVLVEDACEAMGTRVNGACAGTLSDAGVFGFYPNKVLTTGEGGMVVSATEKTVTDCRLLANQGRSDRGEFVLQAGFSMRMTELGAALGRTQLKSLSPRLTARCLLAEKYATALSGTSVGLPSGPYRDRSWFSFPILLPADVGRHRVIEFLRREDIETSAGFTAVHQASPGHANQFKITPVPVSESLGKRLLCLPFWPGMDDSIVEAVVARLGSALG